MGALCSQLIKQLREAGYDGIISVPAVPPPGVTTEVVPEKYLNKIVTIDVDWEAPIVSDAYRNCCREYVKKFNSTPIGMVTQVYDVMTSLFDCLSSQNTMDSTQWMEAFAARRWQGIYGKETGWIGKPLFGIDRMLPRAPWPSEYINGKLVTKWEAPFPIDLFVEK